LEKEVSELILLKNSMNRSATAFESEMIELLISKDIMLSEGFLFLFSIEFIVLHSALGFPLFLVNCAG
jgi:hypothetical protein